MRLLRWFRGWRLALIVSLIVVMVLFGYVLPRSTGDRFANALIHLNLIESQTYLCPDTSVGQVASLFGGENTLGSWLAEQLQRGIQIPGWAEVANNLSLESTYNPLTGGYTASYVMQRTLEIGGFQIQGGVKTPAITLGVRRLTPISFCLTVM
jgi:hypothetical protein